MDWEVLKEKVIEAPPPKNIGEVIQLALDSGWRMDVVSIAVRLQKESCLPCFAVWHLNPATMRFLFKGARVNLITDELSGMLTLRDLKTYLADPTVIQKKEKKENVSPWGS